MPKRGSTQARGYGRTHQLTRAKWKPLVEQGGVDCWRCGERIPPTAPWDLGHDDLDRSIIRGPEHRRCNRAVKGRNPNAPATMRTGVGGRRAPRSCEVCAAVYVPTYTGQRTCGRACGGELRKRNHPPQVKQPLWPCQDCGLVLESQAKRCEPCRDQAHKEYMREYMRNKYRMAHGIPLDAPDQRRRGGGGAWQL